MSSAANELDPRLMNRGTIFAALIGANIPALVLDMLKEKELSSFLFQK
jgi:hypothetical protein